MKLSSQKRCIVLSLTLLSLVFNGTTSADEWSTIVQKAQGQTVYCNGWGGDAINDYLRWAATVSLASGSDRRIISVYALCQFLLPFLVYTSALLLPAVIFRNRRERQN